jgi:hypothetical protein
MEQNPWVRLKTQIGSLRDRAMVWLLSTSNPANTEHHQAAESGVETGITRLLKISGMMRRFHHGREAAVRLVPFKRIGFSTR